ncbi:MAG: hypothetical protein EHM30_03185 [Desulfobacteraceae bacterium]|nr:MAG: hypothetical protein EHM30_03185 [Desulfobacteraceae bacterium]
MPIAIHNNTTTTKLPEEPFKNEAELQACIEQSPYLLFSESESSVTTVQREVGLPSAGILDLLVVDNEGLPVAVEVKLARNAQSRREVVAQAFDYVADLSNLTFDELDEIVDGSLTGVLTALVGPEQFPGLRKICATNLRAGRIRLVIAVDSAGEDLIRIVRYITDHSDIDVRLVSISKFDNGKILVPRLLVVPVSDALSSFGRINSARKVDTTFEAIISAYNLTADDKLQTRGHGSTYRAIYFEDWPDGIHYEFMNKPDWVSVEIHLESDEAAPLAPMLIPFAGQELMPAIILEWDQKWRNRGRLLAKITDYENPDLVASAMRELISRTKPIIDKYYAKR